jgi:hypothetical protein
MRQPHSVRAWWFDVACLRGLVPWGHCKTDRRQSEAVRVIKRQSYCGACQIEMDTLGERSAGPPAGLRRRLLVEFACLDTSVTKENATGAESNGMI